MKSHLVRISPLLLSLVACGGGSAPSPAVPSPGAPMADHDHHQHHAHADHQGGGMHHSFDGAEEWAKVFDDPARDAWQKPDEIVALLALESGMTVADVGAGTGYFEGRLVAAVGASGAVIATDVEADMVRYLGERGARDGWTNVRPLKVEPGDPGLAAGSVDRILIVDVWHHLDARPAYAARLAAALRPGGRIAIVDFTLDAERGPPREHRLAPEAMIAELAAGGLVAEVAEETLPDQYVIIARVR